MTVENTITIDELFDSLDTESSPASTDQIITKKTGETVKKQDKGSGGGGSISFASGIIKSSTSVVNDSSLASISDWSGSAGAYTSTITFNSAKSYEYAQKLVFYQYDGSDYIEIFPTEVKVTSTTTVVITMPINSDLYIGSI